MAAGYDTTQRGSRRKALGLEPARQPKRNSAKYSKPGREEMKEAKLKGESWKGKQALKRQQRGSLDAATGSNSITSVSDKPRTGFNVGPRLGKGSYHGKFTKIKAGLIHNAKIKKQYAQMLKREGINGGGNDMDTEEEEKRDDDGSPMEEDNREDEVVSSSSRKAKGKGRLTEADDVPPVLRKRKSSEFERDDIEEEEADQDGDDDDGPAPGFGTTSSDVKMTKVHPSRSRASESAHKSKKQKIRATEDDIEEKREKREADRRAWGRKTKRGQPNLGSRMNVLLGKIEKTVRK